jgi:hypothetical protein
LSARTRRLAVQYYWGGIATGVMLPTLMEAVVTVARRSRTLGQVFDGFYVRLFAPQESILMLTVLGGAPFLLFGIFALIHLGTADRHGTELAARRHFALQMTYVAMVALAARGALQHSDGARVDGRAGIFVFAFSGCCRGRRDLRVSPGVQAASARTSRLMAQAIAAGILSVRRYSSTCASASVEPHASRRPHVAATGLPDHR